MYCSYGGLHHCLTHQQAAGQVLCAACSLQVPVLQVTYRQPHVLLLDEPSNHLDIDAVDALIDGLNAYKGGVLMVSHDQTLIEATMDELWMCENNTIDVFHGASTLLRAKVLSPCMYMTCKMKHPFSPHWHINRTLFTTR